MPKNFNHLVKSYTAGITLMILTWSCTPSNQYQISAQLVPVRDNPTSEQLNSMKELLSKRMKAFGYDYELTIKNERIDVTMNVPDSSRSYLHRTCPQYTQFDLVELAEPSSIYFALMKYNDILLQKGLVSPQWQNDSLKKASEKEETAPLNDQFESDGMIKTVETETSNENYADDSQDSTTIRSSLLFYLMSFQGTESGSLEMYVSENNLNQALQLLSAPEVKELLPGVTFLCSMDPMKNGSGSIILSDDNIPIYHLYACNYGPTGLALRQPQVISSVYNLNPSLGSYSVIIELGEEDAASFEGITKEMSKAVDVQPRYLAIILDSTVVLAPRVSNVIPNGKVEISGNFSQEQAEDLSQILGAGRVPYPIRITHVEIKRL